MKKQQIRKIKEYAEKLLRLCDGETIPAFKLIEDGQDAHFEACERNAYEAGDIQDKLRRDYRKKVLSVLEDDWVPIARIFEDYKPQKIARLDEMRQSILCHTDADNKYENWLEPRDDNLSPNEYLRSAIHQLADEFFQEAKQAETEQKHEGSKIMITAGTSKENWEAIRSEYDISKKDFGKKINFVSDSFKRKIIFRDVEHAFVLASQSYSKPALILAGGVIEELLRLYLEHKKIKPKTKRFVDYIAACEDNGLLKRGVSRLSDSIRDFRNLVHISKEETKQHTISKATAKGAVSSIFTIANDFQ
jgi:hypothetical protein